MIEYLCLTNNNVVTEYRLAIVCSSEDEEEVSYLWKRLQLFHRDASAVRITDDEINHYLEYHMSQNYSHRQIYASLVDPNR